MTTTITIQQDAIGDLCDGVTLYAVMADGKVIWSGLGSQPSHGLLQVLINMATCGDAEQLGVLDV
jgi:hypothetical protein